MFDIQVANDYLQTSEIDVEIQNAFQCYLKLTSPILAEEDCGSYILKSDVSNQKIIIWEDDLLEVFIDLQNRLHFQFINGDYMICTK